MLFIKNFLFVLIAICITFFSKKIPYTFNFEKIIYRDYVQKEVEEKQTIGIVYIHTCVYAPIGFPFSYSETKIEKNCPNPESFVKQTGLEFSIKSIIFFVLDIAFWYQILVVIRKLLTKMVRL